MRIPRPWRLPTEPTPTAALAAQGITEAMMRTQLAAGRLLRLRPGVVLAAACWPEDAAGRHVLAAQAEQAAYPDSVISHDSAAVIWGLPSPGFRAWADGPAHVTSVSGGRTRYAGAIHHLGPLPPAHLRTRDGYRVTSPARTAVDLAGGSLPEELVLLDAAARLACAEFVARPRRRDYANPHLVAAAREELRLCAVATRRVRLLDAIAVAEPARESAIESLSAGWFRLAGLPAPECQAELRTPAGLLYPDFLWRDRRLIGESDGAVKYSDRAAMVSEKEREQLLRDLGYRIVRWLGKEIMLTPHVVVDRVARALGDA